jgi:hypothetical protein
MSLHCGDSSSRPPCSAQRVVGSRHRRPPAAASISRRAAAAGNTTSPFSLAVSRALAAAFRCPCPTRPRLPACPCTRRRCRHLLWRCSSRRVALFLSAAWSGRLTHSPPSSAKWPRSLFPEWFFQLIAQHHCIAPAARGHPAAVSFTSLGSRLQVAGDRHGPRCHRGRFARPAATWRCLEGPLFGVVSAECFPLAHRQPVGSRLAAFRHIPHRGREGPGLPRHHHIAPKTRFRPAHIGQHRSRPGRAPRP